MMASPAERLIDEVVLHRIALSRYSTATVRRVLALLNRTDARLVERIQRADDEGRSTEQLNRLLFEVRALQADGWVSVRDRLMEDVNGLAGVERDFTSRLVQSSQRLAGLSVSTNVPTTAQVVAAATSRPFQGRFLRDWLTDAEEGAARRVRETIRQGFVEGRSVSQLVSEIRGSRALGYRDGVLEISRRGAEAMVRTALTHTAAVSSKLTYEAMGVTQATFLAVLDSRTTLTCASLNGQTFPLEKFPWPPRHINCRSTSIPVPKGIPKIEAPSYSDWLKRQPEEVQSDILGVRKATLFRSGKLTLDRFVDNKGRELTLDQLSVLSGGAASLKVLTPIGKASTEEMAALVSYTGEGYKGINGALRGYLPFTAAVRDEVGALDQLFNRARLGTDLTLYRGVGPEVIEAYRRNNLRVGSIITDPAFMSTSFSKEEAIKFRADREGAYFIRVLAKVGSKAIHIEQVSHFSDEQEVLFARGQRLKVVSYNHDTRTITAEVL